MRQTTPLLLCLSTFAVCTVGFAPVALHPRSLPAFHVSRSSPRFMSSEPQGSDDASSSGSVTDTQIDPSIPESPMDAAMREQTEKMRRSDELRAQEVFIQRSTGKHQCANCDWQYDETKGDVGVIGGLAQPGTTFLDLPSNWRCPTCRASKDNFNEIVEEIPGFEVNQGYGFGGNSMTGGQKTGIVFGGLGAAFLLMMSGYLMS